jgi:predicted permease
MSSKLTAMSDVVYAFRTFRRAPLAAMTIVATIGLGLGLVTVAFTFFSVFFLRVDAVPHPGELFAFDRPAGPGARAWDPFTRPEFEAMRRETDVFTNSAAMLRAVGARLDGRPVAFTLVTGDFFATAGVRPALGRTLTSDDDARAGARPVVVLSHKGWTRLLDRDPAALGRTISLNGAPYEVVGVMPEDFRGLTASAPDGWGPFGLIGRFRRASAGKEDEVRIDAVIGRLKPGLSSRTAEAALAVWASRLPKADGRQAFARLRPSDGTLKADAAEILMVFTPIFLAFGLVLMIGCANVANLLLARGVSRQKEIGVRLSLGASRSRVIRQLLTESFVLALAAAALGFLLSRLLLAGALRVALTTLPPEFAEQMSLSTPSADWHVIAFLICGALVATASFGLVPALQATRIELVRAMRGEVTRDARPGRARNVLIAVQAGASALLLICAAVFLRSALGVADADPGVRTLDTVSIPIANEPLRTAMVQSVTGHPSVAMVSAHSQPSNATITVAGEMAARPVAYKLVSSDYFEILGIDLLRGRRFTPAERSAEAGVAIVAETIARHHWPGQDAVGQVLRLEGRRSERPDALAPVSGAFTVVGVARDVEGPNVLFELFTYRGVYLPSSLDRPGTSLMVRAHGDPELARRALVDSLVKVDPALGQVTTLRTMSRMLSYFLGFAFWVTVMLGGLALALTLSGLFGVLSYLVEQRARELGVRMALGATAEDIARLVLLQTATPVVVGVAAGAGLALLLAAGLRATPIGSATDIVRVLDPVAYAGSGALILGACALAACIPALRAARLDPIETLRQE